MTPSDPRPLAETEYLSFVDTPPTGSTRRILVEAKKTGAHLGDLRWYGRWRQYVFEPQPNTLFNVECLASLADRVGYLNTMQSASGWAARAKKETQDE